MLGMDKGISDKTNMAQYAYEVFRGHRVPFVSVDLCVVDLSSVNEGRPFAKQSQWMPTVRVGASIARSLLQSLSS